jgi:propanediol utilization protein
MENLSENIEIKVPIEISARHVHLSKEDFEKLFGKDKNLVSMKKLSQIGEFASEQTLTLINGDRKIENSRILGPFRNYSQAEISITDAYSLKLKPLPKIRTSGDLADTTKILVKGPESSIEIPCIIAKNHIHCSFEEAEKLNINNNQKVSLKVLGERKLTFHEVIVRVSENYRLAFHLDTDEGNAIGTYEEIFGEIKNEKSV